MRPLIIFGAGGHAREVAQLVRDINAHTPRWELRAFVSDTAGPHDTVTGIPVLRPSAALEHYGDAYAVIGIGDSGTRQRFAERMRDTGLTFPVVVHPDTKLSEYVTLGPGCTIAAGCIVTVDVEIGAFALLNRGCNVSHDCRIGEFASLAPGTLLSGNVGIGRACQVGTGACFAPSVQIGESTIVGAGAAVVQSLPAHCTAVGVPARIVKTRRSGDAMPLGVGPEDSHLP